MGIVYGPKWPFYSCCDYIRLIGTGFMQVLYLGKAPHTKETLPDFLKWHRVTRHPLVFSGLTGSQPTSGSGASQDWCATYIILLDQCYTKSERSIVLSYTTRRHLLHMNHLLDLRCHLLKFVCTPFEVE